MNKYAVYHRPESRFAYATSARSLAIVLRVAASDRLDTVEILYNNKYDFTKSRTVAPMQKRASDGVFSYYRADIELLDVRFAYVFKITENGKTLYYSEDGLTEDYDFELAYYTFFQFPFINGADIMPVVEWAKSAVFYQIFVERFARGDFDKPDGYINTPWGGAIDRHSFAGGDLDGICGKLSYLSGLGINALYLTPVFTSDTNHKYNVKDYLTVDPMFGDNAKLKKLISAAHELGMRIVIDCIFNHCDKDHEYFRDTIEYGRASRYYDWFIIDGDRPDPDKGNYACFASCKYMPKWNTNNPEVMRYLTDIALEYLRMGFDGLRLDVADEISHAMWRMLRTEVKKAKPDAIIIGEVWHDNEHWLNGDQFDGVMNYKLQKIAVDYFGAVPVSAKTAANRLNRLLFANTDAANAMALNFLDNHDTPRFLRTAGGNTDKLLCALCAVIMFVGMPCVFYGTELPLDGDGDPDCRKTFDWTFENQNAEYAAKVKAALDLKKQPALSGTQVEVAAENDVLFIRRRSGAESVTAYFNTSGKARRLDISGEILFSLNYVTNRILNNGVVVVKNKNY